MDWSWLAGEHAADWASAAANVAVVIVTCAIALGAGLDTRRNRREARLQSTSIAAISFLRAGEALDNIRKLLNKDGIVEDKDTKGVLLCARVARDIIGDAIGRPIQDVRLLSLMLEASENIVALNHLLEQAEDWQSRKGGLDVRDGLSGVFERLRDIDEKIRPICRAAKIPLDDPRKDDPHWLTLRQRAA